MSALPEPIHRRLRRLARRLAIGLFLDAWPRWAVAGLLLAGLAVVICRLSFPGAAPYLPWLWLAPLAAAVPALVVCLRRAYREDEVVALADSLTGGHGLLLALTERTGSAWASAPLAGRCSAIPLPRLRPWRRLAPLPVAAAFLAAALWLPQRVPAPAHSLLADEVVEDLAAVLDELKEQALVTPEEEERLEEEIERIREGAEHRMDAASWEASDALREKVVTALSQKQDALAWAKESLARYEAAAEGGGGAADAQAQAAELTRALQQLARSGLLAGAPADLQRALASGALPGDPKALAELAASVSKYLGEAQGRFGKVARLGEEFGRFDPSEFPLGEGERGEEGDRPGRGGVTRGRADAALTWGEESQPVDRFKAQALPPGAPRSPDDWAPLVELPGAPQEGVITSRQAAARQYAGVAGQAAWRRTLAPRHQSAVKRYFAK